MIGLALCVCAGVAEGQAGGASGTALVDRCNALASADLQSAPGRVPSELDSVVRLARSLGYRKGEALAFQTYGRYYEEWVKDYPDAISCYKRAAAMFGELHEDSAHATDVSGMLNLYFYLGDYPDAMQVSVDELEKSERKKDKRGEAHFDNLIGFVNFQEGNLQECGKYYSSYLALERSLGDSMLEADALIDLADFRSAEKDYRGALTFLGQALDLYRVLGRRERQNFTAFKISQVDEHLGRHREALRYALQPLEDMVPYNQYDLASYEVNAGSVYDALGNTRRALGWLHRGLALATSIRHREDIKNACDALSRVFAREGRFDSAYYYTVKYASLKDSMMNDDARLQIEEINARYEVGKKDQEIALLNQQRQLEEARVERSALIRNIVIISSIFLLILGGLLYNRRRLRQRAAQESAEHRQQNDLFNAVIAVRDQEQKRIARDIHDSLGSLLSAAKLNLSAMEGDTDGFSAEQTERYRATMALLDEAAAELRLVSHNIMPAILTRNGLEAAIQGFVDKLPPHPEMRISYSTHGFSGRLPEQTEILVYRIVLELINNVIKHARATGLTVQLIRYPDYINIIVEDNGVGFTVNRAAWEGASPGVGFGTGLQGIHSRVSFLKGTMDIDSQLGVGTTVVVDIPCP